MGKALAGFPIGLNTFYFSKNKERKTTVIGAVMDGYLVTSVCSCVMNTYYVHRHVVDTNMLLILGLLILIGFGKV